jgi:hypothetical protein
MPRYLEIEDLKEIRAANQKLARVLESSMPKRERRTIGFPGNYLVESVRFAKGSQSIWWHTRDNAAPPVLRNFIGRGTPGQTDTLLIDLQFNFPSAEFNRKLGGVFLRHSETGDVLLGHRGIVTRGKARMQKDRIFAEADLPTVEARASDGRSNDVLVVGPIDHPKLVSLLDSFCQEMRRAATAVAADEVQQTKGGGSRRIPSRTHVEKLSTYFDEFAGSASHRRSGIVLADWAHGRIVASLRKTLEKDFVLYKSRMRDLVAVGAESIRIYEVKSSADLHSLYTAIGQLSGHASGLQELFPGKAIEKILAAPFGRAPKISASVLAELGISIVSVVENGIEYFFEPVKSNQGHS